MRHPGGLVATQTESEPRFLEREGGGGKPSGSHKGSHNGSFPDRSSSNGDSKSKAFVWEVLSHYQQLVLDEIERLIVEQRFRSHLTRALLDYPLRSGKGLRPALCLASCQAHGGELQEALNSAVALELFHNAFLVHDDIEDQSELRRGEPTIHAKYGSAIAINVGDALSVLSMRPLLRNTDIVGLEKTLRIFHEIEHMARESVEGQALELEWTRRNHWRVTERGYFLLTYKKTCWYTCIAPLRIGALIASGRDGRLHALKRFGFFLGVAFQIQDDILNLVGEEERYRKERAGDLWEGKRTIMLIHLLRTGSPAERRQVVEILARPRPEKTVEEVETLLELLHRHRSVDYARTVAQKFAHKAGRLFDQVFGPLPASSHKEFIRGVVNYVIERDL